MESRLKVHPSARFPLFGPLMWHTVAHYHERLLRRAPHARLACWGRPAQRSADSVGADRGSCMCCPS